jgi:hypothetical protein
MTLTIQLPDKVADSLRRAAEQQGVDAGQYAAQLIRDNLPAAERAASLRALFAQWATEDATDDPAEIQRRNDEWAQLRASLNENRASERKLFPE